MDKKQKEETKKSSLEDMKNRVFTMDPRHDVVLKPVELDPLYEKAFLSREEKIKTEYAQNTTTWD